MLRQHQTTSEMLRNLIILGDRAKAYEAVRSLRAGEMLSSLRALNADARAQLIRLLGARDAAESLSTLGPDAGEILADLPADDVADILGEIPQNRRKEILSRMPTAAAGRVSRLLLYGKDTAGGRMGAEFLAFPESLTLGQVTEELRRAPHEPDQVAYLYAVDGEGRLAGVLPMRDLVLRHPSTPVSEALRRDVASIAAHADQEEAARVFRQRRLLALPVVDESQRLVGVIAPDDVAQVIEEEATEDLLKLSGIADGAELSHERIPQAVSRRLPWLVLNLFLNVAAVSVVAYFEGTIQAVVALAVILPMISNMGGNAGIQTLSSTVRGIALGHLGFGHFWKVFAREFLVGALNGVVLGVLLGGIAYFWKGLPALGLIAGVAILANICIGGIMGGLVPLLLHRLKVDPASSAGPILTTITDFTGFFITLKMATALMSLLTPAGV